MYNRLTGLVEQAKYLAIGRIGDLRLAGQVVRLDAIAGCDAILAEQQAEARMFGQIVDLFRFALDEHLAQLVAINCGGRAGGRLSNWHRGWGLRCALT